MYLLRGNSVCILSISSERIGIFQLNLATLIQVSIEAFWHSYTWIWNICTCANCSYSLLHVINKSLDMIWILNLHWGYFLINEVRQWFNQIDHLTFSKIVFWSVNSALSFCQICFCKHCTKFQESHVTTFMTSSCDPIFQAVSLM